MQKGISLLVCAVLLIAMIVVAGMLVLINPFLNPGPLLFRQLRIGQGERPFHLIKFRSMAGVPTSAKFASQEQVRLTGFGRFLRSTHLDELPQVINIIAGHMQLIGPRPEQPAIYYSLANTLSCYRMRSMCKPGLTSKSLILFGYADCLVGHQRRLRLDLANLGRRSWRTDLKIFLATFFVVILRKPLARTNFSVSIALA